MRLNLKFNLSFCFHRHGLLNSQYHLDHLMSFFSLLDTKPRDLQITTVNTVNTVGRINDVAVLTG